MSNRVMSERGRTSGSFLVAVGLVALAVGGYLGWTFLRPDPYALSERVVRDARRGLSSEVREFQRALEDVVRDARRGSGDVPGAVDAASNKALQGVDDVVRDARARLADIDIALRTQRNRLDRIESRANEARDMIAEFAEEAKAKAAAQSN